VCVRGNDGKNGAKKEVISRTPHVRVYAQHNGVTPTHTSDRIGSIAGTTSTCVVVQHAWSVSVRRDQRGNQTEIRERRDVCGCVEIYTTHTHTHIHTIAHAHTHTYTHTHSYIHIQHTHIHTHNYTWIYDQPPHSHTYLNSLTFGMCAY
jgi:hypothetical protein